MKYLLQNKEHGYFKGVIKHSHGPQRMVPYDVWSHVHVGRRCQNISAETRQSPWSCENWEDYCFLSSLYKYRTISDENQEEEEDPISEPPVTDREGLQSLQTFLKHFMSNMSSSAQDASTLTNLLTYQRKIEISMSKSRVQTTIRDFMSWTPCILALYIM